MAAGADLKPRMLGPTVLVTPPPEGARLAMGPVAMVGRPPMDTVVVPAAVAAVPATGPRTAPRVAKATEPAPLGGARVRRATRPVSVMVIAPKEAKPTQAVAPGRATRATTDAAPVEASVAETTGVAPVPDVPAAPAASRPPVREQQVR